MPNCQHIAGGGVGPAFRLWPAISLSDIRRKLLEAVACGVSCHRRPRKKTNKPPISLKPDRLSELLKLDISESEHESETEHEYEAEAELEEAIREAAEGLMSECGDQRKEAAAEVRRLAKDNAGARQAIPARGAIPWLVRMIDADDDGAQISSLYALLNLGIGNQKNKAAIVKEGAIYKMLGLVTSGTALPAVVEAIVANFLGLSALDANKPIIGALPGSIPFLINSFLSDSSGRQLKHDSLRALFNLSLAACNARPLLRSDVLPVVVSAVVDPTEFSDRALSILANLVSEPEARDRVVGSRDALAALVDALGWLDHPSCQENAVYVLMAIAHRSSASTRAAMADAGAASALLELALVGTALAQKRASRVLEILRVDKGKQVSEGFARSVSAAVSVSADGGANVDTRNAVAELVSESLRGNMRRIIRRANIPSDSFTAGAITAVAGTSKSLPF